MGSNSHRGTGTSTLINKYFLLVEYKIIFYQQIKQEVVLIYGYCRISRKTQKIERQIKNISEQYPDAIIFCEAFTGTKVYGRKEFNKLLSKIKSGDTIIFDSVSRMSRNASEGIDLYFDLLDKNINLIFLKEPYINTNVYLESVQQSIDATGNEIADLYIDATNKVIRLLAKKQIEQAFLQAEKEVSDLHDRTKEGIREARRRGKQIGAVKGSTYTSKKKAPSLILIKKHSRDFDGYLNDNDVMKIIGISRNTYYKYKKELLTNLLN